MCKNSGFRSRIQNSYKKFGIESKNLIIFSESIPNLLHLCLTLTLCLTRIAQISWAFPLWVENLTEALRWFTPKVHTDSTRFNKMIICGNLC